MRDFRKEWREVIGAPVGYDFDHTVTHVRTYDKPEYTVEVYLQANGNGKYQRLFFAVPKCADKPLPCIVLPYYFPEGMLGYDPETDEPIEGYTEVAYMDHLARRGYAVASADAFHLSYLGINVQGYKPWLDKVHHWSAAAKSLLADHPTWTGLGKLIFDTSLIVDFVTSDRRVDSDRIGIFGHSLGGIMSFTTGCFDDRIKVILSSDFGMDWDRNNWHDIWYFGDKISEVKDRELTTASMLSLAAPKPFMLLAGYYDNDDSYSIMRSAPGYEDHLDRLRILNHATGHRPPEYAYSKGYDFLDEFLKK